MVFVAVTAAAAPVAYTYMFFGFRPYDDEGYMLVTLNDYLSGKPLVTPFTQLYGPFYYEVMAAAYRALGLVPGHDNGRFATLAVWLAAGALGGVASYRLTRNLWLGVAAEIVTLSVLTSLSAEPMTTYGLIGLLQIGLVVAATFRSTRPRASAVVMGVVVGALCLIKINVGIFAAIGVGVAWLASLPERWRRLGAVPASAASVPVAFILMAGRLDLAWAFEFAAVVALSAAALGAVILTRGLRAMPPPSTGLLALGAVSVTALTIGIAMMGGTSLADVWNGLVVVPIRFPSTFVVPVPIDGGVVVWAAFMLIAALVIGGRVRWSGSVQFGLVRLCAGVFIWLLVLRQPSSLFLLAMPLAWMAALPDRDHDVPGQAYSRVFVPTFALAAVLQAYPVAGSQLGLAAVGLVPVGAMILGDAVRRLRNAGLRLGTVASPSVLAASLAVFMLFGLGAVRQFASGSPLDLPGSRLLRLPAAQAHDLRALVAAIDRNCSSFITYPGMDSFYVWTGQDPPSRMRYGLWWLSLDDAQQQSIVNQISARPGLCVVQDQAVNEFWASGREIPRRPLVDFIDRSFVPSATFGDYQLLVRDD